jgi:RluA family pseudouridine synthase
MRIELREGQVTFPILYEDRAVLAIDKPVGWMLAPAAWDRTGRNLQWALMASLRAGDFWARCRNLKYLRFVHRLDADTSGVLLLAKSPGALRVLSTLFEDRRVEKVYWAVVAGVPGLPEWTCRLKLAPDPELAGRMRLDPRRGKDAITHFRVLQAGPESSLVEARPETGRTHQIRVHLAAVGHPVLGDSLYGRPSSASSERPAGLALRAMALAYCDPFQNRAVRIQAPVAGFADDFVTPPAYESGENRLKRQQAGRTPNASRPRTPSNLRSRSPFKLLHPDT